MKRTILPIVMLMVSVITAEAISINLIQNESFEAPNEEGSEPESWIYFSMVDNPGSGVTSEAAIDGEQSMKIQGMGEADKAQGIFQTIPVKGGKKYDFICEVMNSGDNPFYGSGYFQLVIEWKNAAGQEIERIYSEGLGASTKRGKWSKEEIKNARAPKEAEVAAFGIHLYEGDNGSEGAFLVDSVVVKQK